MSLAQAWVDKIPPPLLHSFSTKKWMSRDCPMRAHLRTIPVVELAVTGIRTVTITMSPIFRELIADSMAGRVDIELVEDLDTRDELEQRLQALVPDLVLIGLQRDEGDETGLSLLRLLPNARVIAFSSDGRNAFVYRMRPQRSELLDVSPQQLLDTILGQSTGKGSRSSLGPHFGPKVDGSAHAKRHTLTASLGYRPQVGSYQRSRGDDAFGQTCSLGGTEMAEEVELTPEELEGLKLEDAEMEELGLEMEEEDAEELEEEDFSESEEGQEALPIVGKITAKIMLKFLLKLAKKLIAKILGNSALKQKFKAAIKAGGRPAFCRLFCSALCRNVPRPLRGICRRLCGIVCRKVYPLIAGKLGVAT